MANHQQEVITHGNRMAALLMCVMYSAIILWFAVPHEVQSWHVEAAARCDDPCLQQQDAVVVDSGRVTEGRTRDLTLRMQSGELVHVSTPFTSLTAYSEGEVVLVKTHENAVVFVADQYAHWSWSELRFITLLPVPACLIIVILLLPKIGQRESLPRGRPSIATTAFVSVLVSMMAGYASILWEAPSWQIPIILMGVGLPLIGFTIGRLWMRRKG